MRSAGALRFSLSYRDVEELLAERGGLHADHVTVWRWVSSRSAELGIGVIP